MTDLENNHHGLTVCPALNVASVAQRKVLSCWATHGSPPIDHLLQCPARWWQNGNSQNQSPSSTLEAALEVPTQPMSSVMSGPGIHQQHLPTSSPHAGVLGPVLKAGSDAEQLSNQAVVTRAVRSLTGGLSCLS